MAVAGICAEKRRQKRWHDKNVCTKEFHKGDLVLLYTLKKQKRKLKMRGLGPFVINEITNGGAVRLETLDGEPMSTFINGSRLKRFHEPLTEAMLECMHAAKNRKIALQQMKDDAQAEAKERAAKAKARRLQISHLNLHDEEDDDYVEPLLISIGLTNPHNTCTSILDSGADVNVLSADVYQRLSTNELLPSSSVFNSFSNSSSAFQGVLTMTIYLQGC